MRLAILSRNPDLYSTRRLVEAATVLGHAVRVIDPLRCYMNISAETPSIRYGGSALDDLDAVIPRIGASITFYGTAVLRQFERMGVLTLNDSVAVSRARDKLRCLQILSRRGIGMPVTGFVHAVSDIGPAIELVGGPPVVIKLLEGTQGIGVVLAENRAAAESTMEAFIGLQANILVQEYIAEAAGRDLRCFVVERRVVAAMYRQGRAGDFRSNLHRGGHAEPVRITPEERRIAARAARLVGLNVAGVDILRSKRGPLVVEVNASPGLEGIERVTGKDIAAMVIRSVEKRAGSVPRGERGGG